MSLRYGTKVLGGAERSPDRTRMPRDSSARAAGVLALRVNAVISYSVSLVSERGIGEWRGLIWTTDKAAILEEAVQDVRAYLASGAEEEDADLGAGHAVPSSDCVDYLGW